MARLIYRGLADPMQGPVSEANRFWVNRALPRPERSPVHARQLLQQGGYSWDSSGRLLDSSGHEVTFSILSSAGNSQRAQIATLLQEDLKEFGIQASIVTLEFRATLDRIFRTFDDDAAVMTLASGDTNPNSGINVLVLMATRAFGISGARQPPAGNRRLTV
jgi:peptide/nickel transport system substrate-binding protein